MTTKKIIIITTILTISAISGCFWYVQTVKEQRNNIVNNDENLEAKENIWDANISTPSIEEEMDISNWQTYRNEEYGFEIKYPRSWTMVQKENYQSDNKKTFVCADFFPDQCPVAVLLDDTEEKRIRIDVFSRSEDMNESDYMKKNEWSDGMLSGCHKTAKWKLHDNLLLRLFMLTESANLNDEKLTITERKECEEINDDVFDYIFETVRVF